MNVAAKTWAATQAYDMPLEQMDPGNPYLFQSDAALPYFERLRREAPVHYCDAGIFAPYWSITRYRDILQVEADTATFSSDVSLGGITIRDQRTDFTMPMFIAMDPPRHESQRAAVSPMFAAANLAKLEDSICARAAAVLDELPVGETFDWVDRVSVELTTQMLAILFDFPWNERRKLTRWSDVATAIDESSVCESPEARIAELRECLQTFSELFARRLAAPPRPDLLSMLAHAESTRSMQPMELLGNVILLIVGGNDTTRNSMTGGVVALNRHPEQYARLRADQTLVAAMAPEIIRWQTPLAHMRRTATRDVEFGGQQIRKGDRVVMWYLSGNRDEREFERAEEFIIGRPRPKKHLSFGFGIHRCIGERLAEMQLRVVWEEILKRFDMIEVMGEPRRVLSAFIRGYEALPVRINRRLS